MTNPYTTQAIANYNTSPPADDATAVASNQLFWSKHKDKLADPIKTLAEAVNTELVTAFNGVDLNLKRAITTNDTQLAADERKLISATNSITYTLLAAVTAGDGFTVTVLNAGTGVITIDANGAELINGVASALLSRQGDAVKLRCNAVGWDIAQDHRRSYDFAIDEAKGTDIASATTTDIGAATGNQVDITGTTTITGLGTIQAGTRREVQFDGILTLTHNATSLILPGAADITTAAGDTGAFISLGSGNWRCHDYQRADGTSVAGSLSLETKKATTSGTTSTFTGIVAGAKRITLMFEGVSTSGTSLPMIQIGDAGGLETTGYNGAVMQTLSGNTPSGANYSTGFALAGLHADTDVFSGTAVLTLIDPILDTWTFMSSLGTHSAQIRTQTGGGNKSLTEVLTQIRLTTVNGTDTFDAGAWNILIEI